VHSNDFTKQASQFIACLSSFITEMRRCELLLRTFESVVAVGGCSSQAASTHADAGNNAAVSPERDELIKYVSTYTFIYTRFTQGHC
jgi:hypothetical protein